MKLSEKIINLRKSKGWSQEELAEKLNISRQSISRWENETALPDGYNIVQLSELFDVTADYLLKEDCVLINETVFSEESCKTKKNKKRSIGHLVASIVFIISGFICLIIAIDNLEIFYAILAVADEVFSKKLKWTYVGEVIEQLPIFQMVPGIIAGNTAIYIGRKIAGLPGAIVALIGVFLPSVIVFSFVCAGYKMIPFGNVYLDAAFLGLRAALTGIIAAMIIRGWKKSVDSPLAFFVMLLALTFVALILNMFIKKK